MAEDLVLDLGPEWRAFDEEQRQRRSRVGAALTPRIHDWGVDTVFHSTDERMRKLARLHKKVIQQDHVNVVRTLQHLNRLCNSLRLPAHVCDEAALIARRLARVYDLKGIVIQRYVHEMLAAAAVVAATARNGMQLPDEIAGYPRQRLLHLLWQRGVVYTRDMGRTVYSIISSIVEKLELHRAAPDAVRIFNAYGRYVGGHTPRTQAAASVYVAAKINDIPVSQPKIASAAGTSDASVRNAARKMKIRVVYEVYDGDKLFYREEWYTGASTYGLATPSELLARLGFKKHPYEKHIGDPIKIVIRL